MPANDLPPRPQLGLLLGCFGLNARPCTCPAGPCLNMGDVDVKAVAHPATWHGPVCAEKFLGMEGLEVAGCQTRAF